MIVLLTAIVSGSALGAVLAWVKAASTLGVVLGYIGGGWIGLLVALAFLLLRPEPDDAAPGCARTASPRRRGPTALGSPVALRGQAR